MYNHELSHVGVLGMRWGRRTGNTASTGSKTGVKNKLKEDDSAEDTNTTTKRGIKSMNDAELRAVVNRIQLEKQYSQLTAKEKSAGEKFVKGVLTDAAKQTATKYTAAYMSKAVGAMMKKVSK